MPPCVGHPATVASPEVDGFANGSQTPPKEGLLSRCTLGNNNNNADDDDDDDDDYDDDNRKFPTSSYALSV